MERSGEEITPDTEELSGNSRLLKAAVQDVRETLKSAARLPEIRTCSGEVTKRAYAAAEAYLSATHDVFEKNSFLAYVSGVEEETPLEIAEVWGLKAMLQLVLLNEVTALARQTMRKEQPLTGVEETKGAPSVQLSSLIRSLRTISDLDWGEVFEKLSVVERTLHKDPLGTYPVMDSESRDLYRKAIEQLAARSEASEVEIAQAAVTLAQTAKIEWDSEARMKERRQHVGFYLVGRGRALLERQIGFRPALSTRIECAALAWPEIFYLVGIELLTFAAMAFVLGGVFTRVPLIIGLVLILLPAIEAAVGVMNQLVSFILPPRVLPKLDFSTGIPAEHATLVVVPTQLLDETYVARMVRELEIRYLANRDPNLHFALLTDLPDSLQPFEDRNDELVGVCSNQIEGLNSKYAGDGRGTFFLFHRRRVFNPSEGAWMGWERKRGKLLDLNNLLRGNFGSFSVIIGDLSVLPRLKYVITLDSDTQLPRDSARRLVATLAHPLNRAVIDPRTNIVIEGYGIIQPKVGISVHAASRSILASIYSGQTGFDPYSRACSDVYQDLFGEGIFTGKGIYEIDVFQRVLGERFPCNAILSHDLIEGVHARTALATDVEVIDDYPSHFSAYSRRKHRWVRGDWQIIRWLLPRVPDLNGNLVPNPLSLISRWKILDNLRRSVIEIATLGLLLGAWFFEPGSPMRWTAGTLVLILLPAYMQILLGTLRAFRSEYIFGALRETLETFIAYQVSVFFLLAFLPHQTLVLLDAIIRTLIRLTVTKRKLLEWETAAEAERRTRRTRVDAYLSWIPWFSLSICLILALFRPGALVVAAPFLILWACSGQLSRWLTGPVRPRKEALSLRNQDFLRAVGLWTWRYFREHACESRHGLVPDNVQEIPPRVAERISPTNLGLLLNSQLAALELGYLTLPEFVRDVERTLTTAKRLARHRGHFLNWYDTQTLEPLEPLFVSTADSGNLATCLWTLKQGCLRLSQQAPFGPALWRGISDHLNYLAQLGGTAQIPRHASHRVRQLCAWSDVLGEHGSAWVRALPALEQSIREIERECGLNLETAGEFGWWISETMERIKSARAVITEFTPWLAPEYSALSSLLRINIEERYTSPTLESIPSILADLDGDLGKLEPQGPAASQDAVSAQTAALHRALPICMAEVEGLTRKLRALAEAADSLVREMDFRALCNHDRRLLAIGLNVRTGRLETSCYDLLASEARAAYFVAIAKGDIPTKTWLNLGRAHVAWAGERVLLSWAGTMFEYLMPTLWMKDFPRTVLDQGGRSAVSCHQRWAAILGVPWGISEAAYSVTDEDGNYQYRSFGVPAMALRRTPPDDLVIAPYATFLALAIDPAAAVRNLLHMKDLNWLGPLGFYESVDFAPSRQEAGCTHKIVPMWMAHHQGMSLCAICNLLRDGVLQELFHNEPAVAATELLLHERLSRTIRVEPGEPMPAFRQGMRRNLEGVQRMVSERLLSAEGLEGRGSL
ncbi:MAG: glucoamylase family protein [Terriglobia bacterium]